MGIVIPTHERKMFFADLHPLLVMVTSHLFYFFFLVLSRHAQGTEGEGAKRTLVSVSAKQPGKLEDASLAYFDFGFPI